MVLTVVLGTLSSLLAGGLLWFFRQRVREALAALDLSAGAALAWMMAFVMLVVIVAFTFADRDVPVSVTTVFVLLVAWLLGTTVWRRQ